MGPAGVLMTCPSQCSWCSVVMQLCSEGSQEFLVLQIFTHTVSDDADDLIDGNPGMEMEILL